MDNHDIEHHSKKLKALRLRLESNQLNALRELLPNHVIEDICSSCKYYFRRRLLTPLVTIFHMLGTSLSRDGSFQSAWQLSGESGRSGALSRARKRLPLEIWSRLGKWIEEEIEKETGEEYRWRGHRMIGIDGTGVSMADEPELAEEFGRSENRNGHSQFPIAQVGIAFNLKTFVSVAHRVDHNHVSETALIKELLPDLKAGDILVGDRNFAGANYYSYYQRAGLEFITPAHHCLQWEKLQKLKVLGQEDFVVELGMSPKHRRKDPTHPEVIHVRMIRTTVWIRERERSFWLVSSLLDPEKYPADEIKEWYRRRWRVETLIGELKGWLGADVLHSKTVEGVYKEFYARVIGLNLIHWLILKASGRIKGCEPKDVSFVAAVRLAAAYSLKMSLAPVGRLRELYEELLEKILCSRVVQRLGRTEPRLRKRVNSSYGKLKIPRSTWRLLHAA